MVNCRQSKKSWEKRHFLEIAPFLGPCGSKIKGLPYKKSLQAWGFSWLKIFYVYNLKIKAKVSGQNLAFKIELIYLLKRKINKHLKMATSPHFVLFHNSVHNFNHKEDIVVLQSPLKKREEEKKWDGSNEGEREREKRREREAAT